jgi:putative addiction module CopG family antidote
MSRHILTVSLSPADAEFLENCVASGAYQSADDVIQAALRHLEVQQSGDPADIERLRLQIAEGAADLDRGDTVDAETFLREWRSDLAELEPRDHGDASTVRDAG